MLAFRLTRHLRWHGWMNALPRHSSTWCRSVLCIIITLAYILFSLWLLIKINKNIVPRPRVWNYTRAVPHAFIALRDNLTFTLLSRFFLNYNLQHNYRLGRNSLTVSSRTDKTDFHEILYWKFLADLVNKWRFWWNYNIYINPFLVQLMHLYSLLKQD